MSQTVRTQGKKKSALCIKRFTSLDTCCYKHVSRRYLDGVTVPPLDDALNGKLRLGFARRWHKKKLFSYGILCENRRKAALKPRWPQRYIIRLINTLQFFNVFADLPDLMRTAVYPGMSHVQRCTLQNCTRTVADLKWCTMNDLWQIRMIDWAPQNEWRRMIARPHVLAPWIWSAHDLGEKTRNATELWRVILWLVPWSHIFHFCFKLQHRSLLR